jgi:hypothetical protein
MATLTYALNHKRNEAFELGKYKAFLVGHIKDGKPNEFLMEHLGVIDPAVHEFYHDFLNRLRCFEPDDCVIDDPMNIGKVAHYVIMDSYYGLAGEIGKELWEVHS